MPLRPPLMTVNTFSDVGEVSRGGCLDQLIQRETESVILFLALNGGKSPGRENTWTLASGLEFLVTLPLIHSAALEICVSLSANEHIDTLPRTNRIH